MYVHVYIIVYVLLHIKECMCEIYIKECICVRFILDFITIDIKKNVQIRTCLHTSTIHVDFKIKVLKDISDF